MVSRDIRQIAIISAIEQSTTLWRVGMFATDEWPSVARACTKFLCKTVCPLLCDLGCNRAECRSHIDHVSANRWLERLGARRQCVLTDLGINRDRYVQYAWTWSRIDQFFYRQNVYNLLICRMLIVTARRICAAIYCNIVIKFATVSGASGQISEQSSRQCMTEL